MSSFANDAAWSLLTDKVDKALPLVPLLIGGAFAGMGAATGSGFRLMNPETGKFDPGVHEGAMIQDPITGGLVFETSTDTVGVDATSTEGRVLGGVTGALQGINPASYVSGAGKALQIGGKAARTSRPLRSTTKTVDGITDVTHGPLRGAGQMAGRSVENAGRGLRTMGRSKPARYLGRFAQTLGGTQEQFGNQAAALLAGYGAQQMANSDFNLAGGGNAGGFGTGFGSAEGGVNDISNVQGNAMAGNQIFDPNAFIGNANAVAFEEQEEFGGLGMKQKGEIMFVNNKGNEIKKEVTDLMYKAKCPKCDKASCSCDDEKKAMCPSCGKMQKMCGCEKKADDKKKPAHGMVIVIGSKAGPGPSKDGKREKLDSEKKEE